MSFSFSLKAAPRFERLGLSSSKCFLHSSPKYKKGPYRPPSSRTRLVKDLKPARAGGRLEVAPRGRQSQVEHRSPVPPRSGSRRSGENFASDKYGSDTRRGRSEGTPRPAENFASGRQEPDARRGRSEGTPRSAEDFSQWAQSTPARIRNNIPMFNELYHPPAPATITSTNNRPRSLSTIDEKLPVNFTSPPLLPGFVACLTDILGPKPRPTPIQALSLKWLLAQNPSTQLSEDGWRQFLLAAETGSGKSIAYLLPVLQGLKQSEMRMHDAKTEGRGPAPKFELNPRALVLAPTHELSRQLSGFAKSLSHEVKLRVLCASRANVKNTRVDESPRKKMLAQFEEMDDVESTDNVETRKARIPVDLVVGTPMKLLEMVRGRGWDRQEGEDGSDDTEVGRWRRVPGKPEMGLANVEWVVVDEADVLFDPDFQEYTRMLLADISAARGISIPFSRESSLSVKTSAETDRSKPVEGTDALPLNYPFNLVLTTATIPSALASYLDSHHPNLIRLASPNLHRLPKTLKIQHVTWTGGNKFVDIERRIRQVWADDSVGTMSGPTLLSKILIFCNKSTKVRELGGYLTERGIKTIALTSTSEERKHGSNKHLDGFLRPLSTKPRREQRVNQFVPERDDPHVMITTSLLSRGLDFSPDLRHVFIVDQPRNLIDFLHRAGRSGRAGQKGNVVIFGKMKGRGSAQAKEAKRRVHGLVA